MTVARDKSLLNLLDELQLPAQSLLIELNREPLLPSDFGKTVLRDGDEIELLRIAAGG